MKSSERRRPPSSSKDTEYGCLVIAIGIDTIAYFLLPDQNIDFFYIGYGNKPFYPILNLIFTTQICMEYYPLYLIAFALYYGLGSLLMYFLFKGIHGLEELLLIHLKQKRIHNIKKVLIENIPISWTIIARA